VRGERRILAPRSRAGELAAFIEVCGLSRRIVGLSSHPSHPLCPLSRRKMTFGSASILRHRPLKAYAPVLRLSAFKYSR
jgi:hypothetical protein